jgi:hypothetical protein
VVIVRTFHWAEIHGCWSGLGDLVPNGPNGLQRREINNNTNKSFFLEDLRPEFLVIATLKLDFPKPFSSATDTAQA